MPSDDEPTQPGYDLTTGEQMVLHSISQQIITAKMTVYNLNAALELALKEVKAAEDKFKGVLELLANSHGMGAAQISPDFKRITPAKEPSI